MSRPKRSEVAELLRLDKEIRAINRRIARVRPGPAARRQLSALVDELEAWDARARTCGVWPPRSTSEVLH